MRLQVEGLEKAEQKFRHLWGRYIVGFKPATHCIKSFVTRDEKQVRPSMADDGYDLDDTYELFYLCGVGYKERHTPMYIWRCGQEPGAWPPLARSMASDSLFRMRRLFRSLTLCF
jgi:hypothetical protein